MKWIILFLIIIFSIGCLVNVDYDSLSPENKIKRLKRRLKWELWTYKDEEEIKFWKYLFDIISTTDGGDIDITRDDTTRDVLSYKFKKHNIIIQPLWPSFKNDNSFSVIIKRKNKKDIYIYSKYRHYALCDIIKDLIFIKLDIFLDEWRNEQSIKCEKEYKENVKLANEILNNGK